MKKRIVLGCLLAFSSGIALFSQNQRPEIIAWQDFENGLSADRVATGTWTVGGDATDNTNLYTSGGHSLRMDGTTQVTTYTSPLLSRPSATHKVRLEFNHIAMLAASKGGVIQIQTADAGPWQPLLYDAGDLRYDLRWGGGTAGFRNHFYKTCYRDVIPEGWGWSVQSETPVNDYWKREVFLVDGVLRGELNFRIRFSIPTVNANWWGWAIDDIKVYCGATAASNVIIPSIKMENYPTVTTWTTAQDIHITAHIKDSAAGGIRTGDSTYIEYCVGSDNNFIRVPMVSVSGDLYKGTIPFMGFDTIIRWRMVVTDQLLNQNCFPYIWNSYASYKCIRSVMDTTDISVGSVSQDALLFKTDQRKNRYEVRYSAAELRGQGHTAGRIDAFGFNILSTANGTMDGLKISYRFIPQGAQLRGNNVFSETAKFKTIYDQNTPIPPVGWFMIDPSEYMQWDGESDLVFQTCWDNGPRVASAGTARVATYPVTEEIYKTVQFYSADATGVACSSSPNASDPIVVKKPVLRLIFGPKDTLKKDAGIGATIVQPTNGQVVAGTPNTLRVVLRNYGSDTLKNCKIKYSLIGSTDTTVYNWSYLNDADRIAVAPHHSKEVTISTTIQFTSGFHRLKVWNDHLLNLTAGATARDTLLANDWEHSNDTAIFEIKACENAVGMQGDYAIGNIQGIPATKTFSTFYQAFEMLKACGVQAPVRFRVAKGNYKESFRAPSTINGAATDKTITFEGEGDTLPTLMVKNAGEPATTVLALQNAKHLSFKNLVFNGDGFVSQGTSAALVLLDQATDNITFDSCFFIDSTTATPRYALLNLEAAKNITVNRCTFDGKANQAIYMKGVSATNQGKNNKIENNKFQNIIKGGIRAELQENLTISKNSIRTKQERQTTLQYAIFVQNANRVNISKNSFMLYNICGVTLAGIKGDVSRSVVANNWISATNANSGSSAVSTFGINLEDGENIDIAYNSIYAIDMGNPNFSATGICLGYPSKEIKTTTVKNNIVVSDGAGQALQIRTTTPTTLRLEHNLYHKLSTQSATPNHIIFKQQATTYTDIASWKQETRLDTNSYVSDPMFLAWDNLSTSNTFLCGKGVAYTNITDDHYGRPRPATAPCIGALEFLPPQANIKMLSGIMELDSISEVGGIYSYEGCRLNDVYVKAKFVNIGVGVIAAGDIKLCYSVDGQAVSNAQIDTLNFLIPPDSTFIYQFRLPYNFSVASVGQDKQFSIRLWVISTVDEVRNNDTTACYVLSKYSLPAVPQQSMNIAYGDSARIVVASQDTLYWYAGTNTTALLHKGTTYTTSRLYEDTNFYYSRKTEIPVPRITEIQVSKVATAQGVTQGLPSYVTSNNAYEISNLGNGDMHLKGYKFSVYTTTVATAGLPDRPTNTFVFPDIVLAPYKTIIVQENTGQSADTTLYVNMQPINPRPSQLYKSGFVLFAPDNKVIDAVTINGGQFAPATNIPDSIWRGGMLSLAQGTIRYAGVSRIKAHAVDSSGWNVSTTTKPMTLTTFDSDLVVYPENKCDGARSVYHIDVANPPQFDPGIIAVAIEGRTVGSTCNLNMEQVKLHIRNTGAATITNPIPVVCTVYDNGTLVSTQNDTVNLQIPAGDSLWFTLTQPIDLSANDANKDFRIQAVVNYNGDDVHTNDTMFTTITSLRTPHRPVVAAVSIPYGEKTTLTATSQDTLFWYASPQAARPLIKGHSYTTPYLFQTDTFYVAAMLVTNDTVELGTGVAFNLTTVTGYPSPFNSAVRNVKEQYLITANELTALGYEKGSIDSLSFHIKAASAGTQLNDYTVKIGYTNETALSSWVTGLDMVFKDTIRLSTTDNDKWKRIPFSQSFAYDGTSNIVVEVAFSAAVARPGSTYQTATPTASTLSYTDARAEVHSYMGNALSYLIRPDIRLHVNTFGCSSDRVPLTVNVGQRPDCDAGLLSIISPQPSGAVATTATEVKVKMKNFGAAPLLNATIQWKLNDVNQTPYSWTGNLAQDGEQEVVISTRNFEPGQNHLTVWVEKDCDTIRTNDTLKLDFPVCLGHTATTTTLTIGQDGTSDYPSFSAAVLKLKKAGICGNIQFRVKPGVYNEQVQFPRIEGTSDINRITFESENGDSTTVTLTAQPTTEDSNYVVAFNGATYVSFKGITIKNTSTTMNRVVAIGGNSENIAFSNCVFETQQSGASNVVSNIYAEGGNKFIAITRSRIIGGYNGISILRDGGGIATQNVQFAQNTISGFLRAGIEMQGVSDFLIDSNYIRTIANGTNETKGITLTDVSAAGMIKRNRIYLTDGTTGTKQGIAFLRAAGTDISAIQLINNSISLTNTTEAGALNYVGISLDDASHTNVFYNSVLLQTNRRSPVSRALFVGATGSNIKIQNNNLDHQGLGHAYYVSSPGTQVVLSNYNNYTSIGTDICFWQRNRATLADLRTANGQDGQSVSVVNVFESDSVLNPLRPNLSGKGLVMGDILEDIRGVFRPNSPAPSIGCYEYQYDSVDVGVISIEAPVSSTRYIEGDPIFVRATVQNFGLKAATSIPLTAVLKQTRTGAAVSTAQFTYSGNLRTLQTQQITFTTALFPPIPAQLLTDSIYVSVFSGQNDDAKRSNDTVHMAIFVAPAYNLNAQMLRVPTERCELFDKQVKITIKNVGEKAITATERITATFVVENDPSKNITETFNLPLADGQTGAMTNTIAKNGTFTYTFQRRQSYYPPDTVAPGGDFQWKTKAWVKVQRNGVSVDNVPDNDSIGNTIIYAKKSPTNPVAHNDTIYYRSWGHPSATQAEQLPIQWYKTSTDMSPFYAPGNYASSQNYTTIQLERDTMFYIETKTTGADQCKSSKVPIRVVLRPRVAQDGEIVGIVEPIYTSGWVYMTAQDSVKVQIRNNGTAPITNFPVTYFIKERGGDPSTEQLQTETVIESIAPGDSYTYLFNSRANFSDPAKTYEIRSWIHIVGDPTPENDSLKTIFMTPKNGNTIYSVNTVATPASPDISNVMIGQLSNPSNPSGNTYTDYTTSVAPAILYRGSYDSIYVKLDKHNADQTPSTVPPQKGYVYVGIDWNRNGSFQYVFMDSALIGQTVQHAINIPSNTILGTRRLRVILTMTPFTGSSINLNNVRVQQGEVEDYLVTVVRPHPIDAELMRFAAPKNYLYDANQDISVVIRNTGATPFNAASIHWENNGGAVQTVAFNESLQPGDRRTVLLQNTDLPVGNNHLKAWVELNGDTNKDNDTAKLKSHLFHTLDLDFFTDFDDGNDYFFPTNTDPRKTSAWEMGTPDPNNTTINTPYSGSTSWKTKLSGKYPLNDESILYSPVFNITHIKPDTLSFMMHMNTAANAYMYVEYLSLDKKWKRLTNGGDTTTGVNWYKVSDTNRFTGQKPWRKYAISLAASGTLFDMGSIVQFRFVFRSGAGQELDGFAIDDFKLRRGVIQFDVGVVAAEVTPNIFPNFGSYYYPKIRVRNYGTDPIANFTAKYIAGDMLIAHSENVSVGNGGLQPNDSMEYTFRQGRYLTVGVSSPFSLCVFTYMGQDIYSDNDSLCTMVTIGPLQKDVGMIAIVSPTQTAAANAEQEVTIHFKNYGADFLTELPVTYSIPNLAHVEEVVYFDPPLYIGDEYSYTFRQKFRSGLGRINIKAWLGLPGDFFADNDTMYKRVQCQNNARDLAAKYIVVDETNPNVLALQLAFVNRSAIAVDSIKVGYFVNGDRTAIQEETFGVLAAGSEARYSFTATLPKAGGPYTSITAFVSAPDEQDPSNDTTRVAYIGYRDLSADTIQVEQTPDPNCRVRIVVRNRGTLHVASPGAPAQITAKFVLDNDWENPFVETFTINNSVEGQPIYLQFAAEIPRSASSNYKIVGWIEYQGDIDKSNDTTKAWSIKGHFVDPTTMTNLSDGELAFQLMQNKPNPYSKETRIEFVLPREGKAKLRITNSLGQTVFAREEHYSEGRHTIPFLRNDLPEGIYYYTLEFEGKTQTKKMIIANK